MSKKKLKPKRHLLFVFLLVVVVAALAGVWLNSRPVIYKDFSLAKNTNGKFQIDVPKQMKLAQSGINILDYQDMKNDSKKDIISHVRVESQFVGNQYIDKTKAAISTQLKQKKGSFYDSFRERASNSPSASNLYFGDFKEYNNNPGGLVSNFSYAYPSVEVSGRMMLTFGKDSLYIITVEATKNVWDKNPGAWDHIMSSFKEN